MSRKITSPYDLPLSSGLWFACKGTNHGLEIVESRFHNPSRLALTAIRLPRSKPCAKIKTSSPQPFLCMPSVAMSFILKGQQSDYTGENLWNHPGPTIFEPYKTPRAGKVLDAKIVALVCPSPVVVAASLSYE